MKILNNSDRLNNQFIRLQDEDWLVKQRIAGQCLANIMIEIQQSIIDNEKLNLLDIDKFVEQEIYKNNCLPTFKGYKGFPNSTCISVNKQLVHGIPSNYTLQDGDIVSFDFGVTYEGAIADSAITMIYGESTHKEYIRMIDTTRDCLYNAIKAISIGKRIGVIGNAIYKTAQNAGFNVINSFGGHGIGWNKPHDVPFIANKASIDEGIVIQPGLVIAIEPLLIPGSCSTNTKIDADEWTILTEDMSAHYEHSLYIHSDHVEIITYRGNEDKLIPRNVYFN